MPKPRYDEEENVSRHGAADKADCEEMAEKYGWELVDVEETNDPILEVDCVFEGKTEFPKSYYDTDKEEGEDA
ncbi:hypothetical protein [Microseira wollei]|uniref:Uncharacterized protein n=1 Tax=Microseira wollei NIES-4236 TaxID=2530354 RepID=A0AAV3XH58_9CYAN|nr:hypothetical protein [Microseira wollei]GET40843.1 hypothetical protein MiSe_56550 [Microseira wollei NIES-4236]